MRLFSPAWSTPTVLALCLVVGIGGIYIGRISMRGAALLPPSHTKDPLAQSAPSRSMEASPAPTEISSAPPPQTPALAANVTETSLQSLWEQPRTPERDREIAAALEILARRDPKKAMALAMAQQNWPLREMLLNAALKGWATVAPDDAASYVLTVAEDQRGFAATAVLSALSHDAPAAIRLASRFCAEDPAHAAEYGHNLINSLTEIGDFAAAQSFALSQGTPEQRQSWINSTFYRWAQHQPAQALAAARQIDDQMLRSEASGGVISGWAFAEPSSLADYAARLPSGTDRAQMLNQALPEWVRRDPVSALKWMEHFEPSADFDAASAAIANLSPLLNQRPQEALSWGSSIVDANLRAETLRSVVDQWAQRDSAAARSYVEQAQDLQGSDRAMLLQQLAERSTAP